MGCFQMDWFSDGFSGDRIRDDADFFKRILDGSWTVRVRTTTILVSVFFIRFSEDRLDDIVKMFRKIRDS